MIFRFCSGSMTPARRSRKSAEASTNTSGSCRRSKRCESAPPRSSRSTPLSTKMHVSRSPIARWRISAATVESTPPLSAQTTRPVSYLRADSRRRLFHKRRHRPVARAATDAVGKVAENVETALGMDDFRMEEQRIEASIGIGHRGDGRKSNVQFDRRSIRRFKTRKNNYCR